MTRFGTPVQQRGNFSLAFRKDAGLDEEQISTAARDAVALCRDMVTRAKSRLSKNAVDNDIEAHARFYFHLDRKGFQEEKPSILKDIGVLQTRINQEFLLKITPVIDTEKGESLTADGKTRMRSFESPHPDRPFRREVVHYRDPTDYGDKGMKSREDMRYVGNVHLKASLFTSPPQAAFVMLHEFCHKFLGFHDGRNDNWYFGPDGNTPVDVGKFDHYSASTELLVTADAMAWFIVKVAGKMDKMDKIGCILS